MYWVLTCLLALALGAPLAAAPLVWEGAPQPVMQQTQPQRESTSSSRTRIPIKGIIAVIAIVLGVGGWIFKKVAGGKQPQQSHAPIRQDVQAGYGPSPYDAGGMPLHQGGPAAGPRPVGQRPQGAPAARPANPAAPGQRPVAQRPQSAPGARPANPAAPGQQASAPGQRPAAPRQAPPRPAQRPPQPPRGQV